MDKEKQEQADQVHEVEEVHDDDVDSTASSDSFIDDDVENNDDMDIDIDGESRPEEPLNEQEIEELIAELLEVESKAAEAQEALEEESLAKVEADVREELAQSLIGDELEKAVEQEMETLREEWEEVLDELETESANLLEQVDGAGVDLPSLYKRIESEAPNSCCTEAWRKRAHWIGSQASSDVTEAIGDAEKHLQVHRPVKQRHGKVLEEGASGFLGKKVNSGNGSEDCEVKNEIDWCSFNKICSDPSALDAATFGSKNWASVYLASTPQQAAELGLTFPGVDEVEEIDDIEGDSDPFLADAIANEKNLEMSDEHKRKIRKVKEEDDAKVDQKIQLRLKQRRHRKRRKGEVVEKESSVDRLTKHGGLAHSEYSCRPPLKEAEQIISDHEKPLDQSNKSQSSSDGDENLATGSSSDTDSESADDVNDTLISKRRRKKKIRRILDDAELGEETKRKIAIEKERQERLKSLGRQTNARMISSVGRSNHLCESGSVEVVGDARTGYIINVAREEGEEAVRIPPSISEKLKPHQIAGIRFMWENVIQSITNVKSGDKGLGCILAHTMGLGKTFQVIAFLYTAMRVVDLGLRTALIVTPISVIHNWRLEFTKWKPSELKPLRTFMLEDVPRERRADLLRKWRRKGGIFLIGYTSFRNLSFGKHVRDRTMAREISEALQDGPDILVCDEAHIIKNTKADITQALKQVRCQRRIALTGSPLQNNLMEYYCMVDFVREGFLGSSNEFRNRFQNPIENGQHTNSTADDVKIMNQRSHILYEQMKGFVQRMDMNVVKKDLPPKTVFVITVKLSPLQRKLYKRFLDVHGFTSDKVSGEKLRKTSFFAGYQALAQIWNHPGILQLMKENKDSRRREDAVENFLGDDSSSDDNLDYNMIRGEKLSGNSGISIRKHDYGFLDEDWWSDLLQENNYKDIDYGGKMVLLLDILKMCSAIGDKALVFSQSIPTLDLIELYISRLPRSEKSRKLWKRGKDWYRLDGRTECSERQKLVERFNDNSNRRVKCALISTRAGSLGINFHAANRVIIVDGSWNPTYDLQAIYRVWRYGQTKPVFAYRLLAHGTMEEKIYKRQVTKEGLAARVVDRQQVHRTISKEEMLHLFEFGDDENLDPFTELGEESEVKITGRIGSFLSKKLPLKESSSSDKLMQGLVERHQPRWVANYHEHETLLQENEDEKLSKEEQDMAWEVFRKSLAWEEEVNRVAPNETAQEQQYTAAADQMPRPPIKASTILDKDKLARLFEGRSRYRSYIVPRKCTGFSHLMTLRSQGIQMGRCTVCGECAREVSWEDLNV